MQICDQPDPARLVQFNVLVIGKISKTCSDAQAHYQKGIDTMARLHLKELKEHGSNKEKEAEELKRQMNIGKKGQYIIGLDERGKEYTSVALSEKFETLRDQGKREFTLVIGGAFGLTEELRAQCDELLALSKFTLPHDLARVVLLEQIYRALHIQKKSGYHHA